MKRQARNWGIVVVVILLLVLPVSAAAHVELPDGGIIGSHVELPEGGMVGAHVELPEGGMVGAHVELPEGGIAGAHVELPDGSFLNGYVAHPVLGRAAVTGEPDAVPEPAPIAKGLTPIVPLAWSTGLMVVGLAVALLAVAVAKRRSRTVDYRGRLV